VAGAEAAAASIEAALADHARRLRRPTAVS
jgi:hypothetical protein